MDLKSLLSDFFILLFDNICYNNSGEYDMERTKIIATYGPSSKDEKVLKEMIKNGLDVLRINMSYTSREELLKIIETVKKINKELNTYVSIMMDTKGNNILIGRLNGGKAELKTGSKIRIYRDRIIGDETKFTTSFNKFVHETRVGCLLKINDGLIELEVLEKTEEYLICNVNVGGEIRDNQKIIPSNVTYSIPFLTTENYDDIFFASKNPDIDYIALSDVRTSEDILCVNDILIENNNDHIQIIAKIETRQSLDELDEIINASDGVMVARGDLGVEVPIERVPGIQKMVINKCHALGKISIVATEMMSSMIHQMRPTRAEVSDIANAVLDGTDAVLLSGETTMGDHPIEVLDMMAKIIASTEENIDYLNFLDKAYRTEEDNITGIIAYSVTTAANDLKAKAIVTPTLSGATARKISRFRPKCLILAATPNVQVIKSLNLNFGVVPIYINELSSLDKIMKKVKVLAKEKLALKAEDQIIITGSYPFEEHLETNFMQITKIQQDD